MKLYDQHLHSKFSFDSRTDPKDNVQQAISRGLAGLTFTEHFDTDPEDWSSCVYDDESYSQALSALRETHGQNIFIGKGIEVDYAPEREDFILKFLDTHEFDLVMLSVHRFGQAQVHHKKNWQGWDVPRGTRHYLQTVLEAVQWCAKIKQQHGRVFDVLGHLDLVKRYTQRFFGQVDVAQCDDLITEILQACLEADLTPEINTSTLRQGLDEPMPALSTVQRYIELGGVSVSIGSDAHRAADIGAGFDQAVEILREAKVSSLAWFEKRLCHDITLAL